MISSELISERLISATFETSGGPLTVFEVYVTDTLYGDNLIETLYVPLQAKLNELTSKSKFMLISDFNAKVDQHVAWTEATERYGLTKANDRGLYFLQFCAINKLVISSTLYRHNMSRRANWLSPDKKKPWTKLTTSSSKKEIKPHLKNSRTYISADIGSDHSVVLAYFKIDRKKKKKSKSTPKCIIGKSWSLAKQYTRTLKFE